MTDDLVFLAQILAQQLQLSEIHNSWQSWSVMPAALRIGI